MNSEIPDDIAVNDFADLLGVTPRTVRNQINEGIITRTGRGRIALKSSVRALLDTARQDRPESSLDRARARALDARTRAQELRIAREDRTLISMEDALAAIEEVTATFVVAVESLPTRLTRNLQIRAELEEIVFVIRQEVSEKIHKRADELAKGIDHDS